jgi:N-acetylglucosaminyldiphosphoundecaprenol N-acetyl-beta-D-mannosaminyltransferase
MRHPDPNFGYPSMSLLKHERLASCLEISLGQSFMRTGAQVLDSHIDAISWEQAVARISGWAASHQSRFVTFCNVHSVVTASQDAAFHEVIAQADLALPDGGPVAWALRREGFSDQERVSGPDLMWHYLAHAEQEGQSVFFYGSALDTLEKLRTRIEAHFPKLKIAGLESPPFRALTPAEDQAYVDQINRSGANVVFVSLGCPKQEAWMKDHRGRIRAVMLGVGAAFDYHSGLLDRAPLWAQKAVLEWLFRLCSEPRRLFKRYLVTNTIFIGRTLKAMMMGPPPHPNSREDDQC